MFKKTTPDTRPDVVIDGVLAHMQETNLDIDDYTKLVDQLDKLYKIKTNNKSGPVSLDVLLPVLANLAGIGMILTHERVHVITTKALGFVMKSR